MVVGRMCCKKNNKVDKNDHGIVGGQETKRLPFKNVFMK